MIIHEKFIAMKSDSYSITLMYNKNGSSNANLNFL